MHLRENDIREIVNDIVGKPEDLTGHERERRQAVEKYGIKLLDDLSDYMDTEDAEDCCMRDHLMGFADGFEAGRKVPV